MYLMWSLVYSQSVCIPNEWIQMFNPKWQYLSFFVWLNLTKSFIGNFTYLSQSYLHGAIILVYLSNGLEWFRCIHIIENSITFIINIIVQPANRPPTHPWCCYCCCCYIAAVVVKKRKFRFNNTNRFICFFLCVYLVFFSPSSAPCVSVYRPAYHGTCH